MTARKGKAAEAPEPEAVEAEPEVVEAEAAPAELEVVLAVGISGTRDGVAWPGPGGRAKLPADEARGLVDAGFARIADGN